MTTSTSILFNNTTSLNCSRLDSSNEWTLSQATVLALTSINSLFAVFGIFGNALVLIVIKSNRILRSIPDFLIFSLSLADLIVTTVYVPLYIIFMVRQELLENSTFMTAKSFVGHLAMLASIASIVGITIDRLVAIRWPLRYSRLLTKKTAFIFIFIAWLISAFIATSYSFYKPKRIYLICYCMTGLVATILMYSYLLKVAHNQRQRIIAVRYREEGHQSHQPGDKPVNSKTLKERKAAKTFAIVIGVFVITWIPLLIYTSSVSTSEKWFLEGFLWVACFSLWNSFVNPYVYFARSRRYRTIAFQMLGIKGWLVSRRISAETIVATTIVRKTSSSN